MWSQILVRFALSVTVNEIAFLVENICYMTKISKRSKTKNAKKTKKAKKTQKTKKA